MSMARPAREVNITLRVEVDVLTWARVRAGFAGTSVNALIRQFLSEYAAVPPVPWTDGRPAVERFREEMDPVGAGLRAREGASQAPKRT
jgi:isocitrate dehydrogenase